MKISRETWRILNDESRIQRRDMWFERMRSLFAGNEDEYCRARVFTLGGSVPRPADESMAYTHPEDWIGECLTLLAAQMECEEDRFAPECVEYPIYGVHFIDKIFGADVFFQNGQWNARYLTTPIGSLQMPALEESEAWLLAKRAAQAFLEAQVRLPLFGLPTLSSALNIFINLYGGEALVAMLEEPEAARHDLTVINDLICWLHRWYLENIPAAQLQPVISWARTQPPGYGQLCGCSTHLLSGRLYAEMIAPLDDRLLGEYPHGGMIHLCGSHIQCLRAFRNMKNLRAVQLNDRAAGDLAAYFTGLRDDQILYVSPCPEMPEERILQITEGKRTILVRGGSAPSRPGRAGGEMPSGITEPLDSCGNHMVY